MEKGRTEINYFDEISFLEKLGLKPELISKVVKRSEKRMIRKRENFCETGKTSNEIALLAHGLLKAKFELDYNNCEIISRFFYTPRNIIVASYSSYFLRCRSTETIEAVEDSCLLVFERKELDELYEEEPELNRVGREFAETSYVQAMQRIYQLQTMSSKDLMKSFYETHPELANRIKVSDLCSYLGINRNAMARLLKNK